MQVLHSYCCGLDVHKHFVVACLIQHTQDGKQHKELRRFPSMLLPFYFTTHLSRQFHPHLFC
jgi:hypothetical protein